MKIMIVDDSRDMRQLLREIVAPANAEILECEDGDLAIEQFGRFRPDWTVMDLRLPRIDGLIATRILRRTWPDSRVVMISEIDLPSVAAAAHQAGAEKFIPKSDLMRLPAILDT